MVTVTATNESLLPARFTYEFNQIPILVKNWGGQVSHGCSTTDAG